MVKLTVITTSHPLDDHRIFLKQALPLSRKGIEVNMIGFSGSELTKRRIKNIKIYLLKPSKGRYASFILNPLKAFLKALQIKTDVYQFHDPEFLPWGLLLQWLSGRPVIFDAHELYFATFYKFHSLPMRIMGKIYLVLERLALPRFAGTITPTEYVDKYYAKFSKQAIAFASYPSIQAINSPLPEFNEHRIAFIGGISKTRAADLIPLVMEKVSAEVPNAKLVVAGKASDESGRKLINVGYPWLEYKGFVPSSQLPKLLQTCSVGWVYMRYSLNHSCAFPAKLGDYMAAGLPVVAPQELAYTAWLVKKTGCGLLVPSCEDIEANANALVYLLKHPEYGKILGMKGREAIKAWMNNETQLENLIKFYKKLLGGN
jgi:glycosyltransferase involved in cell wall biosynthesis